MNYILNNNKNTIDHHHNTMQSTGTTAEAFCHQRIEDEALESESDSSCHAIILFTSETSVPVSPMISTSKGNHHGTGKKSNNCIALDRKPAPQPQPQPQPQPHPEVCPSSSSSSSLTLAKTIPRLGGLHGGSDRRTTTSEDRADNHNHPKNVNTNNDNATGMVLLALEVVHHRRPHHHDEDISSSSAKDKKYDDDDEEDLLLIDDEPIKSNSEYRKELLKDDMRMFGKDLSRLLIYDNGLDRSDSSESESGSNICLEEDDYLLE